MTIAEDVSTPAVFKTAGGFTGTTMTSASFTPPANSLIVVFTGIGRQAAFTGTPTMTVSGGSLTWTKLVYQSDTVNKFNSAGFFYASVGSSPAAMTVTATRSDTNGAGGMLAVRVLTGAASPPIQLVASVTTSTTTTGSASVIPNAVGSQIYCATVWGTQPETITPNGNTTSVSDFDDSTDGEHLTFGKGSALTTSTSGITYGWTASTATDNILQIFEVEASGGTTFSASPADPERLTDAATAVRATVPTAANPERLTDAATRVQALVRTAADPEQLTDLVSYGYQRAGSGADPERLTDSVNAGYLHIPTNSPVPNPMRLTDSASITKGTEIHVPTVAVLDSNGVSTATIWTT